MSDKFQIGPEHRTNDLSHIDSPLKAEVYYQNGKIRIYDNIHYPDRFADAAFRNNSQVSSVKMVSESGDHEYVIGRKERGF